MNNKAELAVKAMAGMMGAESGILPPPRTRIASFAAAVADMQVGDTPVAKVMELDTRLSVTDALAANSEMCERMRNNVAPSVRQARRKNPDAEYSVETTPLTTKTGMYVIALVTRIA